MSDHLPIPSARPARHNGWTLARQRRFLEHLAVHASVAGAARAAGMSRQSAYWLRRQPHARDFAQAWDAALADRDRWIEDLAMDRMLDGEEEVIERDGQTVAVRRRPADVRLLLFYLKRLERRDLDREIRIRHESSSVSKMRAELRALAGLPADGPEIQPGDDRLKD
ncbi:hypothetical protein [Sandarakinorhabdus oryzae]|uniref:hypothetical protein n=1 Tax=Sandarakinorhabdus oryzae TaxID=2675220 RepID=UPI0012E1728F|nr:hypothetical protein [Sandarakinorhabdus oryzae]